jgi:Rps23 Pro-64 3,4-dihydroxylase Tpa1-like proline 4-hydroxylase
VNDFRFLAQRDFSQLRNSYSIAQPFPHIEIDEFLNPSAALVGSQEFPSPTDSSWVHYSHFNEDKCAITNSTKMPDFFRELVAELNSQSFIEILEELTGISNLKSDPTLQGGGLHLTKKGGFLNIHADFTAHPIKRNWQRRVNLLLYFNQNWRESYEGHLELWSRDMKYCARKVSPKLNKCVIFNTDSDSFHGVPEPLNCPPEMTRNSLALYFYTETKTRAKLRATNYQARPNKKDNKTIIWLDKALVSIYTRTKAKLGISDQSVGVLLKKLRKNKN